MKKEEAFCIQGKKKQGKSCSDFNEGVIQHTRCSCFHFCSFLSCSFLPFAFPFSCFLYTCALNAHTQATHYLQREDIKDFEYGNEPPCWEGGKLVNTGRKADLLFRTVYKWNHWSEIATVKFSYTKDNRKYSDGKICSCLSSFYM